MNMLMGILLVFAAAACSTTSPQPSEQQEADLVKNGYAAMTAEDYTTAENLFQQALAMNQLNPYTLLNLGAIYHRTGRFEEARRIYQTLIDLDPPQAAAMATVEGYSGTKLVEIAKINMSKLPAPEQGALEDARRDIDGDGIPNEMDQCSDTPTDAKVNETGCWTLTNLFVSGQSEIHPAAHPQLDAAVAVMHKSPLLRIEIQGHTDSAGSAAFNQQLSEERARVVLQYMVGKGIDPDRLQSAGYGPDHPIAPNDSSKGRSLNRRVELQPLP
jgi:outer membrane protein OmpA-like peptidoglycan-associated protein